MKKAELTHIPFMIFADIVKDIKKHLPKTCTFLSPLKTTKGLLQVRAVIKNTEYRFTTPADLKFTNADVKKLRSSLLEKC